MRSKKQKTVELADYYSIKIRSIWDGLKQESPAFWWLCIYFFLEYVRPQSVYPVIDILPWAQIAIIGAFVTAYKDKSVVWVKNPENALFILFTILVLFSSVFAFYPQISFYKINVMVNWVLAYFLISTIVNTEKRFLVFSLLFLLASFKMSQHGFRTFAGRGFSFASWGATGGPGWFRNSGEFGVQMTIFMPLSIAFILSLKMYWGRFKRLFFYLMPFTGIFSIAATSSRGAQLAIAGVGFWYLIKSRAGIKALAGILVLGLLLYQLLPEEQLYRFQSMGEDSTSLQRLEYWRYGLDTIKSHPITGIGFENWTSYCWFMNPEGLGLMQSCERLHNSFIQAVVELGIPGFLVFVLMIIYVFAINGRTRKNAQLAGNKFILYMSHGLDGGLIGFIISGFFISALFYPFFWIQMAMTVALHQVSCKLTKESGVENNWTKT